MKVLILWAHRDSKNLGLHVLAEGTAQLVRDKWPGANIEYQDYGKGTAPMPLGSPRSLVKEWILKRKGLRDWFKSFDVVFDTRSGDSFSDIYGIRRLLTMTLVAELVKRAGVPIVMPPQTIGPFLTPVGKVLARRSLKTASLVFSRDTASARVADLLGRPVDGTSTDVVFALAPVLKNKQRDVLLNVSGLLWNENPHVDFRKYRDVLQELHSSLVSAGRTVSLLAHVLDGPSMDNDVPAVRAFAHLHAPEAEILIPTSLTDVRLMVGGSNVVIASRMHACLNALSTGTPSIALAYSDKFSPLFEDIGWPHSIDLRSDIDHVAEIMSTLEISSTGEGVSAALMRAESLLETTSTQLDDTMRRAQLKYERP